MKDLIATSFSYEIGEKTENLSFSGADKDGYLAVFIRGGRYRPVVGFSSREQANTAMAVLKLAGRIPSDAYTRTTSQWCPVDVEASGDEALKIDTSEAKVFDCRQ